MPRFRYTAHTMEGKRVTGDETAVDEASLVRTLQGRNLFISRVATAGRDLKVGNVKKMHKKVLDQDRLYFARELATLLNSGIPFDRALTLVSEQVLSVLLAKALEQVREDVNAGLPFHKAISKQPKCIPPLWAHLVEAGETGGNVAGVLKRIASQLEQTIALKKKVVSAVMYPAVLTVMTMGVISVFLLFVIPSFSKVFNSMNAKLPLVTQVIFSMSAAAKIYFIPFVAAMSLAVYLFKKSVQIPLGRRALDLWLLSLPTVGGLVRDIVIARIAINLSAVLDSGVGMIYALDIVSRACGNRIYEEALEGVMEDVRDGAAFSDALSKRSVFTPLMLQMVTVGEESGKLPEMIQKVAVYYEARVDTVVSRVGTLIEPIILIFLGLVIGVIVVALMYPIVTISSALH